MEQEVRRAGGSGEECWLLCSQGAGVVLWLNDWVRGLQNRNRVSIWGPEHETRGVTAGSQSVDTQPVLKAGVCDCTLGRLGRRRCFY